MPTAARTQDLAPNAAQRKGGDPQHVFAVFAKVATVLFAFYSAYRIIQDSFVLDGTRYYNVLDDALISMQYAWNLANGYGLVWNPGERIEGYSNPLIVAIGALLHLFASKTVAIALLQVLGASWVACSAWVARGLCADLMGRGTLSRLRGSMAAPELVLVATLGCYPLFIWSLHGMETGLLTLVVLQGTRLAIREPANVGSAARLSAWLSLAYLCRPDGALLAALLLGYAALVALARTQGASARVREWLGVWCGLALPFLSVIALHLIARKLYYDTWLPNTYHLKIDGVPLADRIADGLAFIGLYLRESYPLITLAMVGAILGRTRVHTLLAAIAATAIGWYVTAGGDFLPTLWRFIVPGMPMLFILATDGAVRGWSRFGGAQVRKLGAWAPLGVALLAIVGAGERYFPRWIEDTEARSRQSRNDTRSARAIARVTTPDATVGVFTAGNIPYYSGRRGVDFLGKMDPVIAATAPHRDVVPDMTQLGARMWPGHAKYDLRHSIIALRPDVLKRAKWFDEDLRPWVRVRYLTLNLPGVSLYLKKDSKRVLWEELVCKGRFCVLAPTSGRAP